MLNCPDLPFTCPPLTLPRPPPNPQPPHMGQMGVFLIITHTPLQHQINFIHSAYMQGKSRPPLCLKTMTGGAAVINHTGSIFKPSS